MGIDMNKTGRFIGWIHLGGIKGCSEKQSSAVTLGYPGLKDYSWLEGKKSF